MANKGRARVLSVNDFARFKDFLSSQRHAECLIAIACIGYYVGLRVGTIAGLRVEDVIDHTGSVRNEVLIRGEINKFKKQITTYFEHPELISSISMYLKSRRSTKVQNLFVTQKNTAYSAKSMSALMQQKFIEAGFTEGYSMHSLRRSFSSRIVEAGGDIMLLKSLMGHESISTTAIYVENDPNTLRNMLRSVD